MNKNLGWKLGAIIVILLVFLYGIFGIPRVCRLKGFSRRCKAGLLSARISKAERT